MNALQQKMLTMLCELDEICRKHEIEYCLFAGSGIGADRHNGFIPWDDDGDIVMTLENYDKLLQVFDDEAKDGRTLNCLEKSSDYPFTYARYVDTTTTAIQRHTAFGGCDPGIKIDIFVMVPTYDDIAKAQKHRLEILAFSEVICPYAIMHHQRPEGYAHVYESELSLYEKLGREAYISKRMPELKHCDNIGNKRYVLFSGMMSNSYIIDSCVMDEIEYTRFENTMLPISKHNVTFSKELYGEGWISKPKAVEIPRHTYLLDIEKPYGEYLDLLWEKCDFDSTEENAALRRNLHIYERDHFKDVLINNQRLRNLALEIAMNNAFSKLEEGSGTDWKDLYDMFAEYYDIQLRNFNKNYGLFINLDRETFSLAMNAAVMLDRYYEAADIISIGIRTGEISETDPEIREIKDRVDICRAVTEAMYIEKDLDKASSIIDEITDKMLLGSLTVKVAGLWSRAAAAAEDEELDKICNEVDSYMAVYGHAGELLSVKGHCLEKKGQLQEAAYIYEKAAANVRNGYVYSWLADKGYSTYEYKYE